MRCLSYVLVSLLLSGCGGFRGGIESVPHVGESDSSQTSVHPPWPHEIVLPGLTLHLSLNNTLRTYQFEVILYIIPTYLNFWDEFRHRDAEALELSLQITAHGSGVTVDPRLLVLTVDGKEFRPTSVWVDNLERERQVIDAFVKARREAPQDPPTPIPRSSEWRDPITSPVALHPGKKSARFIVMFPLPLISPERAVSLDINPAIIEPVRSEKPIIHFKPKRWSEGYS